MAMSTSHVATFAVCWTMASKSCCSLRRRRSSPAGGDVAEEDDYAVFGGTSLDGEPEVERLGVEVFTFACDALVHGAIGSGSGTRLQLHPGSSSEMFLPSSSPLKVSNSRGAAVEEGEVGVAIEADDGVGGRFEDPMKLAEAASRRSSAPLRSVISRK